MSNIFLARLYLRHNETVFSFLSAQLRIGGDGSFTVTMVRAGTTESNVRVRVSSNAVEVGQPGPARKGFRMTYHPTGQVNFRHITGPSIFMEPLANITRNEPLIDISVPDVRRLDKQEKIKPDAAILDVPEGRLTFTLAIAPANVAPEEDTAVWIWKLEPLFSLRLRVSPPLPKHVLKALPEHFHYSARNSGLFERMAIAQDAGLVAFHRAINQSEGDVLYPPNGDGECRMVFVVPMRIPPEVRLDLRDRTLTVEVTRVTTAEFRYRVCDKSGHLVRDLRAIDIAGVKRNAEL